MAAINTSQGTKMVLYTKKNLDNAMYKALYQQISVSAVNLSHRDIAEYKLHYDETKFEEYLSRTYNYILVKKKLKLHHEIEEKVPETLKLVLSREGETDKFTSQFKTVNIEKDNTFTNSSCSVSTSSVSTNSAITSSAITSSASTSSASTSSASTSSSSNSATKVSEQQPLIDPATSKVDINKFDSIRVRKLEFLFENEEAIEKFKLLFFDINSKIQPKGIKRTLSILHNDTNSFIKPILPSKQKIPLKVVEELYQKYFNKTVQDSIVIIANILNMISLSNKHHKFRMDESFKKKTEAEKLKERCDANRMHVRHKKVLEGKLKSQFVEVINTFIDKEFEPTFHMFFLSILTVLRTLEQPKFKKGSIFKNLVLLLWNSLKNSEFDSPKVFGLFRSKSFRPDCIDLISLIEESRYNDPGITDRLALFFLSTVSNREPFQPVLSALTCDSNDELGQLLENSIAKCRLNSKFNDNVEPIQQSVNQKIVTTVKNNVAVENNQKLVFTRAPNGFKQPVFTVQLNNDQNTCKSTYVTAESRTCLKSFPNSLNQTFVSESSTPNAIITPNVTIAPNLTTALNVTIAPNVVTTTVSNGFAGSQTFVIKQPVQNFRPVSASSFQRTDFNTIFVGNKQYQLVRGPTGQLKAIPASSISTATTNVVTTNVVLKPAVSQKPTSDTRCFAKHCKNSATIMCSTCKSVKYCTNTCQRQDWYESHIHNCQRLKSMKQNHC